MASLISPFLSCPPPPPPIITQKSRHRPNLSVSAAKGKGKGKGDANHMVDENMIVLRKRIREIKMEERSYELPCEWLDLEKENYVRYNELVCEAMRVLQSGLMNTRPSLAVGMMVLIALSLPVTSFLVLSNALQIANGVLSRIL